MRIDLQTVLQTRGIDPVLVQRTNTVSTFGFAVGTGELITVFPENKEKKSWNLLVL